MARITGAKAESLVEKYRKAFKNLGYSFFENKDYNLNIFGIRNDSGRADKFDDNMCIAYKIDGTWVVDVYPVTTEPGTSILKRPIKEVRHKGTAILVPNQYRGVYRICWHGSKKNGHEALVQRGGKVKVWRDNNGDDVPDYHGPEEDGWFGINIHKHRGSAARINTGGVSAGCQVFKDTRDFEEFMETCREASKIWGNNFTYTLINEGDLS